MFWIKWFPEGSDCSSNLRNVLHKVVVPLVKRGSNLGNVLYNSSNLGNILNKVVVQDDDVEPFHKVVVKDD